MYGFLKRWRHEIETCELFVVIKMKRQKKLVLKYNLTLEKNREWLLFCQNKGSD